MAGEVSSHKVRGVTVRMRRAGSGDPLLFLHGANGLPIWLPVFEQLSKHFEVIVPEHPGFGASDNPSWMRNIGDLAMFYLDFIDGLGHRPVHLVGHDSRQVLAVLDRYQKLSLSATRNATPEYPVLYGVPDTSWSPEPSTTTASARPETPSAEAYPALEVTPQVPASSCQACLPSEVVPNAP